MERCGDYRCKITIPKHVGYELKMTKELYDHLECIRNTTIHKSEIYFKHRIFGSCTYLFDVLQQFIESNTDTNMYRIPIPFSYKCGDEIELEFTEPVGIFDCKSIQLVEREFCPSIRNITTPRIVFIETGCEHDILSINCMVNEIVIYSNDGITAKNINKNNDLDVTFNTIPMNVIHKDTYTVFQFNEAVFIRSMNVSHKNIKTKPELYNMFCVLYDN